jgi:hypothetical protein
MTRPRRFRDMSLTEGDVLRTVHFHWWTVVYQKQKGAAWRGSYYEFLDRAKRLLPLWRKLGLRELKYEGWIAGHNHATYREESPF